VSAYAATQQGIELELHNESQIVDLVSKLSLRFEGSSDLL
jgi:hypothetical protein